MCIRDSDKSYQREMIDTFLNSVYVLSLIHIFFDCVHYGVLGALNKKPDRPAVQFKPQPAPVPPEKPTPSPEAKPAEKKDTFFRTMTAQEYKTFSAAMADAPKPRPEAAAAAAKKIPGGGNMPLREFVMLPQVRQARCV